MSQNQKCDLRFKGMLLVSNYLIRKYGEVEAIRKAVSRKKIKYIKFK